MPLDLQDKLALALTSAGSMRQLAASLGVTHQKVGRWLREGNPPSGIREIPAAAAKSIGRVFAQHVNISRKTAKAQGLPFRAALPIFATRKPLDTGQLGDRVFIEHAQFLKRATLDKVVVQAQKTKKFAHVSARSIIDIGDYARKQARIEIVERKARGRSHPLSHQALAKSIAEHLEVRLTRDPVLKPIFTQYVPIFPGSDLRASMTEFDMRLRTKHEPSTGSPGTRLADQLLFQLMPKTPAQKTIQKAAQRKKSRRK